MKDLLKNINSIMGLLYPKLAGRIQKEDIKAEEQARAEREALEEAFKHLKEIQKTHYSQGPQAALERWNEYHEWFSTNHPYLPKKVCKQLQRIMHRIWELLQKVARFERRLVDKEYLELREEVDRLLKEAIEEISKHLG